MEFDESFSHAGTPVWDFYRFKALLYWGELVSVRRLFFPLKTTIQVNKTEKVVENGYLGRDEVWKNSSL